MRVRHRIGDESYEVDTKTRIVVTTTIRQHGSIVAQGSAILNPKDNFDQTLGWRISIGRAIDEYGTFRDYVGKNAKKLTSELLQKFKAKAGLDVWEAFQQALDKVGDWIRVIPPIPGVDVLSPYPISLDDYDPIDDEDEIVDAVFPEDNQPTFIGYPIPFSGVPIRFDEFPNWDGE